MLGLIHTQNRPDRDRYITINEEAIDRKSKDQYMPKCYNCQTYDLPYECDSVMHYGWMDFAAAGKNFNLLSMLKRHRARGLCDKGEHGGFVARQGKGK